MQFDAETMNIGHALQRYWTNFAKNENPNEGDGDSWVQYDTHSQMFLEILDDNFNHSIYADEDVCDFWDRIGYAGDYCTDCKVESDESHHRLRAGMIAGIVIGIVCMVAIICLLIWKFMLQDRTDQANKNETLLSQTDYNEL